MNKIIVASAPAASTAGAGSNVYGVLIEESICQGYAVTTTPAVTATVAAAGVPVVAGGVTLQDYAIAITVTYQPCGNCSKTRVETFAETVTVAVPGATATLTPTIGTLTVTPAKVCCNKARAVEIGTSLTIAYA